MKKVRECVTVEKVFEYANVGEKLQHKDIMIRSGYMVSPSPVPVTNDLVVTYGKKECELPD